MCGKLLPPSPFPFLRLSGVWRRSGPWPHKLQMGATQPRALMFDLHTLSFKIDSPHEDGRIGNADFSSTQPTDHFIQGSRELFRWQSQLLNDLTPLRTDNFPLPPPPPPPFPFVLIIALLFMFYTCSSL
uniref:Uncharacterized protein n=1 Tax=Trypanosoma vivax (strain Y486) TaxID=1055687 RepID=G0TSE4_TRYVY|nr:hypothetical protein TVY486_0300640 [Trypanosoma vivax Y486]